MAQVRRAEAHWSGNLAGGGGAVSAISSGAFGDQAITWRARTEAAEGKTSPEELLAAAHAACYSMVSADKTDAGWTVLASHISVRARVPGIDAGTFQEKAEAAKGGCPVSRAISGSVEISLEAVLEA